MKLPRDLAGARLIQHLSPASLNVESAGKTLQVKVLDHFCRR